jgi:hypothetical protein
MATDDTSEVNMPNTNNAKAKTDKWYELKGGHTILPVPGSVPEYKGHL